MKTFGTAGDDYAFSVQQTTDGGYIVAGNTNGLGAGGRDVLLVKLDGSGVIQWAKTAGGPGNDAAYSARQASDGGYIVTGSSDIFTGFDQILLTKFDGIGAFQWASTLGNPTAAGLSVQQTTGGGYIVTGFPDGAIGGLGLLNYDATGHLQWLRRASGTNLYGISVQQTSDGGYIVTGSKQIGTTQYDLTLLKFDASGNLQWAQLAGGSANDFGEAVQQTSDGGYIVAGSTASFGAGGQDVLLLKYDGSGVLQWARTAGGSGDDAADSVQQTSDGGYIVSGRTNSFGANLLLLKFDSTGALQWAKAGGGPQSFAVSGATSGTSVQQTSDGGYVLAGSTTSFGAGGSDVLLIKTDTNGNIAGCANWSSVSPSIGTTFPSAVTSYSVDSPSFSVGAPALSVAAAPLTSNTQCIALVANIQPPINSDGSSVFNDSRGVVPVKFTLTSNGTPTCQLPAATISLTRTVGVSPGPINESLYIISADSDSNFRIDSANCQYVYNLGTGALGPGTYLVQISISGVLVGSATFGLN